MVWSRMAGSATISPGPGGVIMESVGLKFHLIPFTTLPNITVRRLRRVGFIETLTFA